VFHKASSRPSLNQLSPLLSSSFIIWIAGSTYPKDEAILLPAYLTMLRYEPRLRLILVPHEPTETHLLQVTQRLTALKLPFLRYSQIDEQSNWNSPAILLVDTMGRLAELYAFSDLVFVGGSFHGKIHNVLEPVVWAKPVFFGPYYNNSFEAKELVEHRATQVIFNQEDLLKVLSNYCKNPDRRALDGRRALTLIEKKRGASEKIYSEISKFIKRT